MPAGRRAKTGGPAVADVKKDASQMFITPAGHPINLIILESGALFSASFLGGDKRG